jgi:acetoin utilization protein AcuB
MVSILTSYERAPDKYRHVYIRFFDVDREKIPDIKEEVQQTLKPGAQMLYMIDHRENRREIYVG